MARTTCGLPASGGARLGCPEHVVQLAREPLRGTEIPSPLASDSRSALPPPCWRMSDKSGNGTNGRPEVGRSEVRGRSVDVESDRRKRRRFGD